MLKGYVFDLFGGCRFWDGFGACLNGQMMHDYDNITLVVCCTISCYKLQLSF